MRMHFLAQGWVENHDHRSFHFDFKFALAKKWYNMTNFGAELYKTHKPEQIIGYYNNTLCLTTKSGLAVTLKAAANTANPLFRQGLILQSFDVSSLTGVTAFVNQYRRQYCRSICFKWSRPGMSKDDDKVHMVQLSGLLEKQLRLAMAYVLEKPKAIVTDSHWELLKIDAGKEAARELQAWRALKELESKKNAAAAAAEKKQAAVEFLRKKTFGKQTAAKEEKQLSRAEKQAAKEAAEAEKKLAEAERNLANAKRAAEKEAQEAEEQKRKAQKEARKAEEEAAEAERMAAEAEAAKLGKPVDILDSYLLGEENRVTEADQEKVLYDEPVDLVEEDGAPGAADEADVVDEDVVLVPKEKNVDRVDDVVESKEKNIEDVAPVVEGADDNASSTGSSTGAVLSSTQSASSSSSAVADSGVLFVASAEQVEQSANARENTGTEKKKYAFSPADRAGGVPARSAGEKAPGEKAPDACTENKPSLYSEESVVENAANVINTPVDTSTAPPTIFYESAEQKTEAEKGDHPATESAERKNSGESESRSVHLLLPKPKAMPLKKDDSGDREEKCKMLLKSLERKFKEYPWTGLDGEENL